MASPSYDNYRHARKELEFQENWISNRMSEYAYTLHKDLTFDHVEVEGIVDGIVHAHLMVVGPEDCHGICEIVVPINFIYLYDDEWAQYVETVKERRA